MVVKVESIVSLQMYLLYWEKARFFFLSLSTEGGNRQFNVIHQRHLTNTTEENNTRIAVTEI